MLILSSPAKTLDLSRDFPEKYKYTQPDFLDTTQKLHSLIKELDADQMQEVLNVNPKITQQNYQRFQNWVPQHTVKNSSPALWTYRGDVFKQLQLEQYTNQHLNYAQKSLRIFSGYYGLLKPLDLIQPYRLEMTANLPQLEETKLNQYWRPILTSALNQQAKQGKHSLVLNVASNAYAAAIDPKQLSVPYINLKFQQSQRGQLKTIAIYSKQGRGAMINWLIRNQITHMPQVKEFAELDYHFSPEHSTEDEFIFIK